MYKVLGCIYKDGSDCYTMDLDEVLVYNDGWVRESLLLLYDDDIESTQGIIDAKVRSTMSFHSILL